MGRLDNIIARNRRPNRVQERVIVSILFGAVVLLILALMVFTDLGLPPDSAPTGNAPSRGSIAPAAAPQHGKRVDGVLLGVPRRPAQR